MAFEKFESVDKSEACKKIFLKDSRGLIVKNRSSGGITEEKEIFAHDYKEMNDLVPTFKCKETNWKFHRNVKLSFRRKLLGLFNRRF